MRTEIGSMVGSGVGVEEFTGILKEFDVEFRENCMYFKYLLCRIPGEIPREFSSPTPDTGMDSRIIGSMEDSKTTSNSGRQPPRL
jgi:hypothetical protein